MMHTRPRKVLFSPLGQLSRAILVRHFGHTVIASLVVLSIALSIDLPAQLPGVAHMAASRGSLGRAAIVIWFVMLRAADLMPRFLPFATFLGVLWTEIGLTASRERLLIWNSGRSLLQCLLPTVLFALPLTALQFASDAYLRPAAIQVQITDKLGNYGEQFDRKLSARTRWIAFGPSLVHARIGFGPPLVLYDVSIYRIDQNGLLADVDFARSAVPDKQRGYWLLKNGGHWSERAQDLAGQIDLTFLSNGEAPTRFATRRVQLAADPLMLSQWGIYPEFLRQSTLRALIHNAFPANPPTIFINRLTFNFADAAMPLAMALLAATLGLLYFTYSLPTIPVQLSVLLIGYLGHLAMKSLLLMGGHGYMSPYLATPLAPILILLICAVLLAVHRSPSFDPTKLRRLLGRLAGLRSSTA